MTESYLRVGTLVLSVVSTAAAVGMYIAILQIKNAILTERDVMKGWVLEEIRRAVN
ncbi:MAG TPA: hypothetical protein VK752_05130 [Bryobacteraceae bacterium]|jgi:hypothetical protein|nr:hypothetical protein [Bryobacteraceae bacterium]